MDNPAIAEVIAHSATAVLAVWLGLTVVSRSPAPPARIFGFVALTIAAWSTSVIVVRLSSAPAASSVARASEELTAALVIAGAAHLALAIASEGHASARRLRVVAALYGLNVPFALAAILDPAVSPPGMATANDPSSAIFGWGWIAVRLATLVLAVTWLVGSFRVAPPRSQRRRQLTAATATVVAGGIGAGLRMIPGIADGEPWIGVSFVTMAVVLASYAVLSAGVFLNQDVAGRAFRTSLLGGIALLAVVGAAVAIEAVARNLLGLDEPLFLVLALVIALAVYEPVTARTRAALGGTSPRAVARDRLLRALGQTTLAGRLADEGLQAAVQRVAGAIGVSGMLVMRHDGSVAAIEGTLGADGMARAIELQAEGRTVGELQVGPTTAGVPPTARDEELLRLSTAYIASALRTGAREEEHVESLADLATDRAAVEAEASALHAALVRHEAASDGLNIYALGSFRVERGGTQIDRWGGDKAGSRQAEALFAFIWDRGERGIAKDEALELIWPDTDIERADLAFHRTMGGLRKTLETGLSDRRSRSIKFHNDRYRLDPALISWSDADEFVASLEAARGATSAAERLGPLERARRLYRADYLDDCPFYGDSHFVEERRAALRDQLADLLVALGETYESGGDRVAAAAAYREALTLGGEGRPRAREGLARVGA